MADEVMLGGWGVTEDATEETQKICDAVSSQSTFILHKLHRLPSGLA